MTEVIVEADENKILRVLQNLVGNAVEAFGGARGSSGDCCDTK